MTTKTVLDSTTVNLVAGALLRSLNRMVPDGGDNGDPCDPTFYEIASFCDAVKANQLEDGEIARWNFSTWGHALVGTLASLGNNVWRATRFNGIPGPDMQPIVKTFDHAEHAINLALRHIAG